MKKIGIIGGIGPASTIEYYQLLIRLFREQLPSSHYPEFVLHSIDMTEMLDYVFKDELDKLVEFLRQRIQVLEASHVDYVALASNTPHLVIDQLSKVVDVELISIVTETCKKVAEAGIKKLGLLGTKSTMSKGFYQAEGAKHQIEIIAPPESHQDYIHEKYMGELVFNNIYPATKAKLLTIVHELQETEQIEGIILGGTELPLILEQADFDTLKVFDTTRIHVQAILDKMLD